MRSQLKIILLILLALLLFLKCHNSEKKEKDENPIRKETKIATPLKYNPDTKSYFDNLSWKTELSKADEERILRAIDSSGYRYNEYGIKIMVPALVHRLYSVLENENFSWWEDYRKYFSQSKPMSDVQYDNFLFRQVKAEKLKKYNRNKMHYSSIEDELLSAVVIRQSKLLRKGHPQTVNLNESILNYLQLNLLAYSKYSETEAISQLLDKISKLEELITGKEYALLWTLMSYGKEATHHVLDITMDTVEVSSFSNRGRMFIILYLVERAKIDLSDAEREELVDYLYRKEIFSGAFNNQRDEIGRLTSRITGEDLESCHNRVGVFWDKELKQKMMDRIAKQMEEDKRKRENK